MAHKGTAMPLAPQMALEVTVVSGEGVRVPSGRPLSRGAYAVVRTASSSAPTRVDDDADCHGYPYWDEAVRVALPAGARWLDVEICRARGGGGAGGGRAEPVAAARVPVEDFSVGPPGHLHCLSYRLFNSACGVQRRNGIVNITVKRIDGVLPAARLTAAGGKAVDYYAAGSASSGGSCCVAAAEQGKPAAPVGTVMGYPAVGC
ncbi:hypothetical protein U9M48_014961 [Paspalum notatum var. saurae]|uniref:C2 domain-containing protein n=1 Tax=Paspalum notatum var. saurae TaxID=547442 RepID=A0AAQ3WLD5_PASNO